MDLSAVSKGDVPADSIYKRPKIEPRGPSSSSNAPQKQAVSGSMGNMPPPQPPLQPINKGIPSMSSNNVLTTPIANNNQPQHHNNGPIAYPPQQLQHRPNATPLQQRPPPLQNTSTLQQNRPPPINNPSAMQQRPPVQNTFAPRPAAVNGQTEPLHSKMSPIQQNGQPVNIIKTNAPLAPLQNAQSVNIIRTDAPLAPLNQVNHPR